MGLLMPLLLESCAVTGTNYKREYSKVWKKTIQSEAWKISMVEDNYLPAKPDGLYTSTDQPDRGLFAVVPRKGASAIFEKKYYLLVTRAYFKIISEAEAADGRLKAEYITWSAQAREQQDLSSKASKHGMEVVRRKYEAHREMLEGLKSWNILSEFGTDDLRFFMAEHRDRVLQMYHVGQGEKRIVYYLVYQLADLYHFDE